eukprot:gb/GEZN01001447.1/.p1 GENE.gb/GEZN01001447.1/~~gb/GEZN01001447.1/.p1  ORF type:complete len:972 (-),score=102.20 gb/GEZN01001447.1/:39-2954(-)
MFSWLAFTVVGISAFPTYTQCPSIEATSSKCTTIKSTCFEEGHPQLKAAQALIGLQPNTRSQVRLLYQLWESAELLNHVARIILSEVLPYQVQLVDSPSFPLSCAGFDAALEVWSVGGGVTYDQCTYEGTLPYYGTENWYYSSGNTTLSVNVVSDLKSVQLASSFHPWPGDPSFNFSQTSIAAAIANRDPTVITDNYFALYFDEATRPRLKPVLLFVPEICLSNVSNCALLHIGSASWSSSIVTASMIVANQLLMMLRFHGAGTHENYVKSQLDAAVPVLTYYWQPTMAFANPISTQQLKRIPFDKPASACATNVSRLKLVELKQYDCDYTVSTLDIVVATASTTEKEKEWALSLIRRIRPTDGEINKMLFDLAGGASVEQAACQYMKQSKNWLDWIPQDPTISEPSKKYKVSKSAQTSILVFASLMGLMELVSLIFICTHRSERVIMASSWPFLLTLGVGCLLLLAAAVLIVWDQTPALCSAKLWLVHSGIVCVFGSLLVRLVRLNNIFNNPSFHSLRKGNSNYRLSQVECLMLGFIWLALMIQEVVFPVSVPDATKPQCERRSELIEYLIYSFEAVLLMVLTFLTWRTRNVPSLFNESRTITGTIYNTVFCVFLVAFVSALNVDMALKAVFISSVLLVVSFSNAASLLFYKIVLVRRRIRLAWRTHTSGLAESLNVHSSKTDSNMDENKKEQYFREVLEQQHEANSLVQTLVYQIAQLREQLEFTETKARQMQLQKAKMDLEVKYLESKGWTHPANCGSDRVGSRTTRMDSPVSASTSILRDLTPLKTNRTLLVGDIDIVNVHVSEVGGGEKNNTSEEKEATDNHAKTLATNHSQRRRDPHSSTTETSRPGMSDHSNHASEVEFYKCSADIEFIPSSHLEGHVEPIKISGTVGGVVPDLELSSPKALAQQQFVVGFSSPQPLSQQEPLQQIDQIRGSNQGDGEKAERAMERNQLVGARSEESEVELAVA